MIAVMTLLRAGMVHLAVLFGLEMMFEAIREPVPPKSITVTVRDAAETRVEPWCKSGLGQLSARGVVFIAGATEARDCPPTRARDGSMVATLGDGPNWKSQSSLATDWKSPTDAVTFVDMK
jgi:hypothetical protein